MSSRRIKLTAVGILFSMTAILSVTGYVFEIFEEQIKNITFLHVISDLSTNIKETFSANPLMFSLFFIGLAVLDDLYYAFKYDKSQNDLPVRPGKYIKYLLTGLKAICCKPTIQPTPTNP